MDNNGHHTSEYWQEVFVGHSPTDNIKVLQQWFQEGKNEQATKALAWLVQSYPQEPLYQKVYNQFKQQQQHKAHVQAAQKHFPGKPYLEWLRWFHDQLSPNTYLEIGVESGKSLAYSQNPTLSIGVDPEPKIVHEQDSWVKVFAMPSDEFFFTYDVKQLFNNQAIDLAFIDGLHTFDQALKDFINVEKNSHTNTVAIFHDIYPVTPITAARQRQTNFWLGDTWKVVPLLKEARPDLTIFTIPTYPSGLTVVTGLDAKSKTLTEKLHALTAKWMPVPLDEYPDLSAVLNAIENNEYSVKSGLSVC